MSEREPEFWDCDERAEILVCTGIEDAVHRWADDLYPDPLPETVVVYGFAPMELPGVEKFNGYSLDWLLERLDEDFGPPDDFTDPTPAMKAAERAFHRAVLDEYKPWACEKVAERTENVADHVPAEWLTYGRTPPDSEVPK